MVTFTTDPRIAYARARQQAGMKRAMTPYQLPRNPYGGSPIAGNLQRLADALGSRMFGADAARLQEGQKTAQSKILARLLGAQTGVPGREQYARGQIQVPTQDVQVTGEYRPTPTGGGWQRLTIDDTGATVPDPAVLDPAVLKTAGLSPGEYSILERKAKLAGEKISEAERIDFATRKLTEARTQDERKYWLGQIDAVKAAERDLDVPKLKEWQADLAVLTRDGMPRADAEDIAFGRFKIIIDNKGNKTIVNLRTKEVINLDSLPSASQNIVTDLDQDPDKKPPAELTDKQYWKQKIGRFSEERYRLKSLFTRLHRRTSPVTGVVPWLQEVGEATLGQIPGFEGWFQSDEAAQMRQALETENQLLIKTMQQSPKFAEGERKAIAKEVEITPAILQSHLMLRNKMISIAKSLTRRLRKYEEDADDYNLTNDARQAAVFRANLMRDYLLTLGVPGYGGFGSLTIVPEEATGDELEDSSTVSDAAILESLGLGPSIPGG
jgi:hypothetical protein